VLPGFPSPLADRIELYEMSGQSIQWAVVGFAIEIVKLPLSHAIFAQTG
jgi:hypothetical protein